MPKKDREVLLWKNGVGIFKLNSSSIIETRVALVKIIGEVITRDAGRIREKEFLFCPRDDWPASLMLVLLCRWHQPSEEGGKAP